MSCRPLRVVDVTSFFSSSCGGIRRYYTEKAKFVDPQQIECHFVVPGAETESRPFGNGWLHALKGPLLPGNASYRRFAFDSGLARTLEKLQPDVVEVASHYVLPQMVKRACASLESPPTVVGFFHSHPKQVVQNATNFLPWNAGVGVMSQAMWRFAAWQHRDYDATLAASQHVEDELADRDVPRVRRVGLGVDIDTFFPMPPETSRNAFVTYAGRFTRDKELPLLLSAFESVHARTGARLSLVGQGPIRGWLLGASKQRPWLVVHEPITAPRQMACLLSQSAAVVVPSHTETFSFVTAEAMACGTPVVGADQGAVRELIENSGGGLIFTAGNTDSLAGALEMLLMRSPQEREMMGARGRAYIVENLTWAQVMRRIVHAYDEAIAHKSSQRRTGLASVTSAAA